MKFLDIDEQHIPTRKKNNKVFVVVGRIREYPAILYRKDYDIATENYKQEDEWWNRINKNFYRRTKREFREHYF